VLVVGGITTVGGVVRSGLAGSSEERGWVDGSRPSGPLPKHRRERTPVSLDAIFAYVVGVLAGLAVIGALTVALV
jgi:hypothetical protein